MDLRTGTPLWPSLLEDQLTASQLDHDEKCDVLVVGSGITGAMAATHLAEAGVDVVVVDRRELAQGSTPASTALIQYDLDKPLLELTQMRGRDEAEAVYRIAREALDRLELLIRQQKIECDLQRRPTLYLASARSDVGFLQEETAARQAIGLDVSFIPEPELRQKYRLARNGALRSVTSFELDPCKLTHGLLKAAKASGARLYARTEVPRVGLEAGVPVRTTQGCLIKCRHILFASGYETPEQFETVRKRTQLKSTYALATPPLSSDQIWYDRALLWEHASPYFYARTTSDGRILIGGEDEPFTSAEKRDAAIRQKTDVLLSKLTGLTGIHIERPDFAWAGTFAETADSLPFIGPVQEAPHCLFALGYGGNGFTFSLLAAEIVRDLILNRRNEWAHRFGFLRSI